MPCSRIPPALKPPGHAAISLALGGGTWLFTGSPGSLVVALLVGVFLDLDHLLDYYRWLILDQTHRLLLFLHSYELLIPALFISYTSHWNPLAIAGTLALLGHLLTDQLTNQVRPMGYFFTYRALNSFRTSAMTAPKSRRRMYWDLIRLPLMPRILPPTIALLKKLSRR
ncbi:MAG: hypothetical protein ABID84_02660 [Chloroflexota bacterium]